MHQVDEEVRQRRVCECVVDRPAFDLADDGALPGLGYRARAEEQLVHLVRPRVEANLGDRDRAQRRFAGAERRLVDDADVGDLARLRPVPPLSGDELDECVAVEACQPDLSHRPPPARTRRSRGS